MKTINKFLLKSYLGPMFMTFFIVMFILLMNFLWRYIDELVGKGLPMSVIVELVFYATSTLMPLGLPLATLLAAIMTMGNLGENNELLALKAAGISLPKIMRPLIYMALIISTLSLFVVNNFVPYSFEKMGSILYDIRQQRQEMEFKDGVFFNGIPDISIRVGHQDKTTKKLDDILIYDTRDAANSRTIVAESGFIELSKDKNFLKIKLYNGHNYETNRTWDWYDDPRLSHHTFEYEEMWLELEGYSFKRSGSSVFGEKSSNAMNLKELSKDIDSIQLVVNESMGKMNKSLFFEYLLQKDSTEYLLTKNDSLAAKKHSVFAIGQNFDTLSVDTKARIMQDATEKLRSIGFFVKSAHGDLRVSSMVLYRAQVDWHDKLSLPISIIIFFLIGAPLGAIIRKGGLGTPIVISVIFFVIYYIITMAGKKLVNDGVWPAFYGVWLSSFILFPLAVFLTYKSTTDSQLLNVDWYINKLKESKNIFHRVKNIFQNKKHGK